METHNQSFTAFLMHFFSGQATPVLAQGGARTQFGAALLPLEWIRAVAAIWALGVLGFMFFWIRRVWRVPSLTWVAVLVGVMILPSHLIWKPYFVMSIPVAVLALHRLVSVQGAYRGRLARGLAIFLFAAINLSGFDFVGAAWGARFEAAAVLFWCHLAMLAVVLWPQPKAAPASGRGSF